MVAKLKKVAKGGHGSRRGHPKRRVQANKGKRQEQFVTSFLEIQSGDSGEPRPPRGGGEGRGKKVNYFKRMTKKIIGKKGQSPVGEKKGCREVKGKAIVCDET